MGRKKAQKPKKVNIYFDRLTLQLGFMTNEQAGYLLKLIVYYSMGDTEAVERLQKELERDKLNSLVLMAFAENKVAIDEDLKAYAEVCQKRQEIALQREEKRRAQECTSVHNCDLESTKCTNTNTNTNTNIPNGIDYYWEEEEEEKGEKIFENKDTIIKIDDFVRVWNGIARGFQERSEPCKLKWIHMEDLPEDAEQRINMAVTEIAGRLDATVVENILNANRVQNDRTPTNAAKHYIIRAIRNMAAVRMDAKDKGFGSFEWLFNGRTTRMKKLYNKEIQ